MGALLLRRVWKSRVFGNVVCISQARMNDFVSSFQNCCSVFAALCLFPHLFQDFCAISLILAVLLDNRGLDLCYMRWPGDAVEFGPRAWYEMRIYIEQNSMTAMLRIQS